MTFDDNQKLIAPAPQAVAPTENERRAAFKFNYLCKSKCKALALEQARVLRPANKFKRVSDEFLIAAEAALRQWIASRVKSQPSKGVTLK